MQADITTGKFLDVVIQSDQFYATAIQSIVDVLQSGRICILDVSIKNIYRLQVRVPLPKHVRIRPENCYVYSK